jgi:hypothetical protein
MSLEQAVDNRLKELSADLAAATAERDKAQSALDVARRTEVAAKEAVRNHMKATYGVDPVRL